MSTIQSQRPSAAAVATAVVPPVVLSALLGLRAYRKQSLTPAGCVAAFLSGSVIGTLGGGLGLFMPHGLRGNFKCIGAAAAQQGLAIGVGSGYLPFCAMLNFFYTSTLLTRVGADIKMKKIRVVSEDEYHACGRRTAWQVLCNGGVAVALSLGVCAIQVATVTTALLCAKKCSSSSSSSSASVASASSSGVAAASSSSSSSWLRHACETLTRHPPALILPLVAHFAAAQGDTWSSEIGVLNLSDDAYLIVGLRRVPRGTNGAVTLLGLGAAVAAGLQLGVVLAALQYCCPSCLSSVAPNKTHNNNIGSMTLIGTCVAAAAGGSVLDSILGQFLQASYYLGKAPPHQQQKRSDNNTNKLNARKEEQEEQEQDEKETHQQQQQQQQRGPVPSFPSSLSSPPLPVHICGRAVLSNNGVNLTTLVVTTGVALGISLAAYGREMKGGR